MTGKGGDDVYLYSRGGSSDTITDTAGTDTIKFKDIDIESVVLEFSDDVDNNDMVIKFRDNADSETISTTDIITVTNGKNTGTSSGRIEKFQFGDDIYDVSGITVAYKGTSGGDSHKMESGIGWLSGGAGVDTLNGGAGVDSIDGGAGDDTLYGRDGNDSIDGGEGNDRLNGGAGDDYLNGGTGDDTYWFYRGSGQNVITDTGGSDTIDFITSIVLANIKTLTKNAGDLVITFKDYTDSDKDKITIKNWDDTSPVIETFKFDKTDYKYSLVDGKPALVKKTSSSLDDVYGDGLAYDGDDAVFSSDVNEGFTDLLGLPTDTPFDLL